jgi:hypothetical protein
MRRVVSAFVLFWVLFTRPALDIEVPIMTEEFCSSFGFNIDVDVDVHFNLIFFSNVVTPCNDSTPVVHKKTQYMHVVIQFTFVCEDR